VDESSLQTYASEVLRLQDSAALAQPFTARDAAFDLETAYAVSREVLRQREAAGWRRAGRKIGFTNRQIWDQYGVYEPIFGYMYDHTVLDVSGEGAQVELGLAELAQPLIEPEIVFKLGAPPPETNDAVDLLRCIEWVGHGFEIVQCHFPDWKFRVEDTIADGGLHGRYVVGPRVAVTSVNRGALAKQLSSFHITLLKHGEPVREGGGQLVLGSPLNAFAHLIDVLASLPDHPPLAAGELITTGTLTDAMPVVTGETWSTRIDGLPLTGLELRFG
jgi:2-oxo-3-hexenedioate decarboxylase